MQKLKQVKWGYLFFAVLLITVGVLFIAKNEALTAVAIAFGVLLAVFAAVYFVLTLAKRERGIVFAFRIIFSIIALGCGIATAIAHAYTTEILLMLFGFLLIIDGSFKLQTTVLAKRYHSAWCWIMMFIACTVIVGGAILSKVPFEQLSTQAIILGILLVVDGLGNGFSLFVLPYIEKREREVTVEELELKKQEADAIAEIRAQFDAAMADIRAQEAKTLAEAAEKKKALKKSIKEARREMKKRAKALGNAPSTEEAPSAEETETSSENTEA